MKRVTIYTDGACEGNPGPGGWAAILQFGGKQKEISGGVLATTNNRMELQAALEALRALKEPCEVDLHTDSEYLRNGITKWIFGWKAKGWMTSTKQPVKNEDLWRDLDAARQRHKIHWHWVKGHAGHKENERCDELAVAFIAGIKERHSHAELRVALEQWQTACEDAKPARTMKLFEM